MGAILNNPEVLDAIALELRPEHFYSDHHQLIYKACVDLYTRNETVDTITIGSRLSQEETLERIGGRTYLATLSGASYAGRSTAVIYSTILRELSRKRTAISVLRSNYSDAIRGDRDSTGIIDSTIKQLFDLAIDSANTNIERIGEREVGDFLEALGAPERPGRLSWPWPKLDALLSGLWPSEMTVICGRPGMAKSSMAVNLALHLSMEKKVPVGIFSLEMSKKTIVNRMLSQLSGVDSVRIRDAKLTDDEVQKIYEAAIPLAEAPLYIDDEPGLTESDMIIKARKLRWQVKIGCIIVDYLQLLKPSTRAINREQEVSSFSQAARYIARELQIPVVVLCQLNRSSEMRSDHRPLLSDIRESGALEQDADVVIGLYRDGYYNPEADPSDTEVIVLKHRNGPTDTIHLGFEKRLTTFYAV